MLTGENLSLKQVLLKKDIHKGHGGRSSCQRKRSCYGNIYFVFFCGGCFPIFAIRKHKECAKKGQLVQTNVRMRRR